MHLDNIMIMVQSKGRFGEASDLDHFSPGDDGLGGEQGEIPFETN